MSRIGESATMRVARRAADLRAEGRTIFDFGAGEPDFASPCVAVEAARRALAEGFTKYTHLAGIPDLRAALSARFREQYGAPWEPTSQVLITVGAKAALFELALALFEKGDEVVVPTPCWVSFVDQVRLAEAEAVLVPSQEEDGFALRAEPLLAALRPATRAVILNSPCNPTGGIISRADLERLVAGCAARGILLIADETYERFLYDGAQPASAAAHAAAYPETVVLVGSFSKTYAMTGWRLGYVLGPAAVIGAAAAVQSHATSNATSFAMVGALAALRGGADYVVEMIAEYEQRRNMMVEGLNALAGVRCQRPRGAFYAFPNVEGCLQPGEDSTAFAQRLLEATSVVVVPGAAFGSDRHVRFSFACSRQTIVQGLERLAEHVRRR
jgi:aspartate aminotransferase